MTLKQMHVATLGLAAVVAGGLALATHLPVAQPVLGASEETQATGTPTLMTRQAAIRDLAHRAALSPAAAAARLFPAAQPTTPGARYIVLTAPVTTLATAEQPAGDAGYVYWYAEASAAGHFHGMKRLRYAGYHAGQYAFNGRLHYVLIDANRLHYTLSGRGAVGAAVKDSAKAQVVGLDQASARFFEVEELAAPHGEVYVDADYTW